MAAASHIPLPALLNVHASNLAAEWKRFHGQWLNYVKAAKVDQEAADCQAAILLACIGTDAYCVYESMSLSDEQRASTTELLAAFQRHSLGDTNEVYERYVFNNRKQNGGETFDVFVADLRRLVRTFGYGDTEQSMIRDRIVLGICDDATRKKLLGTRDLDLQKAVDICRAQEATMRQFKAMTSPEDVNALSFKQRKPNRARSQSRGPGRRAKHNSSRPSDDDRQQNDRRAGRRANDDVRNEGLCRYCNRQHERGRNNCPAYGSSCRKCLHKNHYAICCKFWSKEHSNVKQLSDKPESLLALDHDHDRGRVYTHVNVTVSVFDLCLIADQQ